MVNGLTNNRVAIGWPLLKYASDVSAPYSGLSVGSTGGIDGAGNADITFPQAILDHIGYSYQVLFGSLNSYYAYYDGAPAYILHVYGTEEMDFELEQRVKKWTFRLMNPSGTVLASKQISAPSVTDDIKLTFTGRAGGATGGTFTLTMGETELFTYATESGEISDVKFRYRLAYQGGYTNKAMTNWLNIAKLVTYHAKNVDEFHSSHKYFNIADGEWNVTN